jgi:hypothetical protein
MTMTRSDPQWGKHVKKETGLDPVGSFAGQLVSSPNSSGRPAAELAPAPRDSYWARPPRATSDSATQTTASSNVAPAEAPTTNDFPEVRGKHVRQETRSVLTQSQNPVGSFEAQRASSPNGTRLPAETTPAPRDSYWAHLQRATPAPAPEAPMSSNVALAEAPTTDDLPQVRGSQVREESPAAPTPSQRRAPTHTGTKARRSSRTRALRATSILTGTAALATLASGVTYGIYTATTSAEQNAFTSGTVVVKPGTGTSVVCHVTNLAPGDASSGYPAGAGVANTGFTQCRYFVKYTGTVPAYLGLDVKVTNGGGAKLYDGTATGLQLLIKDSAGNTYVGSAAGQGGTKYTAQGGSPFTSTLASGTTVADMLVSTSAKTGSPTAFTDEFTVDYNLSSTSSNDANIGGTTTITLTFHAVQAGNNSLPSGCTAAGTACTGLHWS